MDGEAVKRIADLAVQANQIVKDGITFVSKDYQPLGVVHEDTVRFTTLTSFCRFIDKNPQNFDLSQAVVVIDRSFVVSLLSAPDKLDGKRTVYAMAKEHDFEEFSFGRQYSVEDFIIALKTLFVKEDSDWEAVFNLVKRVQVSDNMEISDDGMSQSLTVRRGVSSASLEHVTKPTDHELRPYRIFPEAEQPKSIFYLRISGSKELGPKVALYETDGGKWKVEASQIIKRFIEDNLFDTNVQIPVYC